MAADTTRGASNIDFNFEPPKIYYDPERFLDFAATNSSICNSVGKILAYTEFMIRYPEMKNMEAEVIIFNMFGKIMLECVVLFSVNGEYSFATDTFENGAYIIVLKDKYTKIRKYLKLLVNSDK